MEAYAGSVITCISVQFVLMSFYIDVRCVRCRVDIIIPFYFEFFIYYFLFDVQKNMEIPLQYTVEFCPIRLDWGSVRSSSYKSPIPAVSLKLKLHGVQRPFENGGLLMVLISVFQESFRLGQNYPSPRPSSCFCLFLQQRELQKRIHQITSLFARVLCHSHSCIEYRGTPVFFFFCFVFFFFCFFF